jgi:hypothetical protein
VVNKSHTLHITISSVHNFRPGCSQQNAQSTEIRVLMCIWVVARPWLQRVTILPFLIIAATTVPLILAVLLTRSLEASTKNSGECFRNLYA